MDMTTKPRLLDQVRERCRVKHYSIRTEKRYVDWIKRFILFHNKRHPSEMGAPEIEALCTKLCPSTSPWFSSFISEVSGVE